MLRNGFGSLSVTESIGIVLELFILGAIVL
jgi:hypothetical protein